MADCSAAAIVIGGRLDASAFNELVTIAREERLSVDYGDEVFEPDHREVGQPLRLCDSEVRWGYFDRLEGWCVDHSLPFARWSGGCAGSFDPERLVFTGIGEPIPYAVTEEDVVMIDRATIARLGSVTEIEKYFAEAEFVVPPLVVEGDPILPAEAK